jgi:phosphoglycolate phosphatase
MKHILFDLDGTLIDSAPSILSCFAKVLEKRGIHPKYELTHSLIGPPLIETMSKISGVTDQKFITDLSNDFKLRYDEVGYKETSAYPGVTDLLKNLISNGKSVYVVTNKREIPTRRIIEHLRWTTMFSGIYSPDSFTPKSNSKSDAIRRTLGLNKILNTDAVYVGDREEDQRAAETNAITFLGVKWGYGAGEFSKRVATADKPSDLESYFRNGFARKEIISN